MAQGIETVGSPRRAARVLRFRIAGRPAPGRAVAAGGKEH